MSGILALTLAGCAVQQETKLSERKVTSSAYADHVIEGQHIRNFIYERCAMILGGKDLDFEIDSMSADSGVLSGRIRGTFRDARAEPPEAPSFGMAAAIDKRGYFLTAAHCIEDETSTVLARMADGKIDLAPIRIVWKSESMDVALIHIERELEFAFKFAESYGPGDTVLAAALMRTQDDEPVWEYQGFEDGGPVLKPIKKSENSDRGLKWDYGGFQDGRLTNVWPKWRDDPPGFLLTHRVPVERGDSGGPLFDLRGRLVAVNCSVIPAFPYQLGNRRQLSCSTAVDESWLRDRIEEDFSRRR